MSGIRHILAWGSRGAVVQYADRWELRAWSSVAIVKSGNGTACPEPGGERLAVIDRAGAISVAGEPQALPPGSSQVTHAAWTCGGLAIEARRAPADVGQAPPHSAREFAAPAGDQSTIWRLPLDGAAPVRIADLPPGTRLYSLVTGNGGEVIAETYRPASRDALPERRLLLVPAAGKPRDLDPELPGATCGAALGPDEEIALLQSDTEFPDWYSLFVGSEGAWQRVLPPELRIWGAPAWAPDRPLVTVPVFRGIRLGVVAVDIETTRWRWLATEGAASYRAPAVGPGGREVVCVRRSIDSDAELVKLSDGGRVSVPLPGREHQGRAGRAVVRRWRRPEGELEGVLVTPTENGPPWPLVVDLHGGPVGFVAGDHDHLHAWCEHGFGAFAPDYRSSGILGREPMLAGLRSDGLPENDAVADDVLSGIDSLVADGLADEARLFLFGHSWGAYLVNRIVTRDRRFRAAVCWEGVADLCLLDSVVGGSAMQRGWRGGSPREAPEQWRVASPIEFVERVQTPMLLVYGDDSEVLKTQGLAWYTALRDHDVPSVLVFYSGEGHLLTRPANKADLFGRSAAWFRQHASDDAPRASLHGPTV